MFFIKLFYFLKGYVIIETEGLFIERFINICIRHGIDLWGVLKSDKTCAKMKISNSDFSKLRPIAKKTRTKVKILKKCGLPSLIRRYRKRYAFFIGAVLFILFFTVSSQFIWDIKIEGCKDIEKTQILSILKEEGVYSGAPKFKMSSEREIKDSLMRSFNSISWAWAYKEGCRIRIKINEGTPPPEITDKSIPCDIVAVRDGIIKKVTVKQGKSMVLENNTVTKGDILIAGTLEKSNGEGFRTVHSQGEVLARTWHEKSGVYRLCNFHRVPTKNEVFGYTLNVFSKSFVLKPVKHNFREYDTFQKTYDLKIGKNHYLGISLVYTKNCEIEKVEEIIPYESAVKFAEFDLEQKIAKELLPGALLEDKKITVENIDDQTIKVTLLMEFTEKIGAQKIIDTKS